MSSDKIDKWVEKNPESWSKLANINDKKVSFAKFKKEFKKGAEANGKKRAIEYMTDAQLKKIYNASGVAKQKTKIVTKDIEFKPFKPEIKTVTRKGKKYKRAFGTRWQKSAELSLTITAQLKPRSDEYNKNIDLLVESTGRSKQAVQKKVQRTRKEFERGAMKNETKKKI